MAPFRLCVRIWPSGIRRKIFCPEEILKIREEAIHRGRSSWKRPRAKKPRCGSNRTASASATHRLTFAMQKQAVAVNYDQLSVIAIDDPRAIDDLWLRLEEQKNPLERLEADVFRELAKLNPQSTVHARTLYGAVNVVRRTAARSRYLEELMNRPYYSHMGDLYYRFDEGQWTGEPVTKIGRAAVDQTHAGHAIPHRLRLVGTQ